eukprot:jgi/Botrbrau1/1325/Bobra.0063s0039.1
MANAPVEVPYVVSDEPRPLGEDDLKFLAEYTRCSDHEVLKNRVLQIWRDVKSNLWVFKCIQELMFLHPRIQSHPKTQAVLGEYRDLQSSKHDKTAFLMEIGSCFGTDLRWLIVEGVDPKDLIATDLTPSYWQYGRKLFDDEDKLQVETAFGSITDDSLIAEGKEDTPLAHVRGRVHNVWAGAVLHVLNKESIEKLMANVHLLLRDGGRLFGTSVGSESAGFFAPTPDGKSMRYVHSPASLTAALESAGFSNVEVTLSTREVRPGDLSNRWTDDGQRKMGLLSYSATKGTVMH